MARFSLTAAAQWDLCRIRNQVARTSGVSGARHLLGALVAAMDGPAEMPRKGHVRDDLTAEPLRFWPVFSYLIIYRPKTSPVEIVRVLDRRRNVVEELR